jgi:hypothetical protein
MDHIPTGLTDHLERTVPPPDSSYAVAILTVPACDLLEPLAEDEIGVAWKAR